MQKVLNEYKGVILFFIVIFVMSNLLVINNKHINSLDTNTIATYEK